MGTPRTVVFVAPFPMATTMRFCRAVSGLADVRLIGLFQRPPPDPAAAGLTAIEVVDDALDVDQLAAATRRISAQWGPVHRLVGVLENIQVQLAEVRGRLGIPGPDVATATAFRDKGVMKARLRAAGVPCARGRVLTHPSHGTEFADEVGLPIVLKPPSGVGCRSTWRVADPAQLAQAMAELAPSPARPVLAEEFLVGAEHSLETLTLGGRPRLWSVTRYLPSPLEAVERPWVQWCVLLPRELDTPLFRAARDLATRSIAALGLQDGMTHMEWFHRPDGTLAVGEIAARPPGAQIVNLMSRAYGHDFHRAWARVVVDGMVDGPFHRRQSTGVAFLRGAGAGRVHRVDGLSEAQALMGDLVVDKALPVPGRPKGDTYEGDGWVVLQDDDTEVVMEALHQLISTVRVRYAAA